MKAINKRFSLWRCCLLLLPLVAVSCQETITPNRDSVPELLPGKGLTRVSLRAGEGSLPAETSIGFYVLYADSKYQYNVKGACIETKWVPTSDWISDSPAKVAVYAPYDGSQWKTESSLNLTAALYDAGKDIVSGNTDVGAQDKSATVTLSHIYTRLQFNLFKAAGDASPETVIYKIELRGADIYSKAKYNPLTVASDALNGYTVDEKSGPTESVDPVILGDLKLTVPVLPAAPLSIDLLLIPVRQAFTGDAYLWVHTTTGKHPMKVKIPAGTFTTGETPDVRPFAPGKQYTINVKLSPTEPIITAVTVNEWGKGESVNGDTE